MCALHVATSLDSSVPLEEVVEIATVLGWPKHSFGFFLSLLWKTPNARFGQLNFGKKSKPLGGVLIQTWTLKIIIFVNFCLHHQITLSPLLLLEIQLTVAVMKSLPYWLAGWWWFLIVSLLYILVPHKNWSYKGKDQRGRKKRIVYRVCVKWGYLGWKEQKPSKMNFR